MYNCTNARHDTFSVANLSIHEFGNWTMTSDVFDILNQINATLANSSSVFDSDQCNRQGGKTKTLWTNGPPYFTVCVQASAPKPGVCSPNRHHLLSSLVVATGSSTGMVVGLSVGFCAFFGAIGVLIGRTWYIKHKKALEQHYLYMEDASLEGEGGIDMEELSLYRLN
ncbi:hypothetical protein AC1031_021958 [Aphanomyces cochlioides]|nr:hypothetical protein AC1031_021958 [Aphanomyces cochlioides]